MLDRMMCAPLRCALCTSHSGVSGSGADGVGLSDGVAAGAAWLQALYRLSAAAWALCILQGALRLSGANA